MYSIHTFCDIFILSIIYFYWSLNQMYFMKRFTGSKVISSSYWFLSLTNFIQNIWCFMFIKRKSNASVEERRRIMYEVDGTFIHLNRWLLSIVMDHKRFQKMMKRSDVKNLSLPNLKVFIGLISKLIFKKFNI